MTRSAVARRAVVRGRVQGVFFRDSCRQQAQELGVTGSAVNASDGSVVVHAEGPAEAVERLLAWLQEGPRRASVDSVEVMGLEPEGRTGFDVG